MVTLVKLILRVHLTLYEIGLKGFGQSPGYKSYGLLG